MPPGVWNQSWSTCTATLVTGRPPLPSLSQVGPACGARNAGPDERCALGQAPGPLDVPARLQRAVAGGFQAAGQDPRIRVRALLEEVALERHEDRALLLSRDSVWELEPPLHGSEGDVSVLSRGHGLALGRQHAKRLHEPGSSLRRLDHVVDVPALGGHVGVGELALVFGDELGPASDRILRLVDL